MRVFGSGSKGHVHARSHGDVSAREVGRFGVDVL